MLTGGMRFGIKGASDHSTHPKGQAMREVTTLTRETTSEGALETSSFSIKANAKAFRILIDGLYSDKPRAIVREIAANALDSHMMAGCADRPFDCHLPSRMEPFFSIRDYGVSLSHQNVMKLYTTVFESTKEDTNDQVGKFGLGSKTPFAYTESYTVTAYLDGVARLYNAFIDSKGVPTIALLMEEPTTEPNGIEVNFPVSSEDCQAFVNAASFTFLGFDVKPNITGNQISYPQVQMEGTGWRALNMDHLGSRGLMVRQGCVIYPVDRAPLLSAMTNHSERETLTRLSEMNVVFDMPVGTIDITPSRESLSYDATTVANILVRLRSIWDEVIAPFIDPIIAKTPWEARCLGSDRFRKIEETFSYSTRESVQKLVKWRNERCPIDRTVRFDYHSDMGHNVPSVYSFSGRYFRRSTRTDRYSFCRENRADRLSMSSLALATQTIFFAKEDELGSIDRLTARIRYYYSEHYEGAVPYTSSIFVVYKTEYQFKRLLVSLGRPPMTMFKHLSVLPVPPKVVRSPKVSNPLVTMRSYTSINSNYTSVQVPTDFGGVIVPLDRETLDRSSCPNNKSGLSVEQIVKLFISMQKTGLIPSTSNLYGVGKSEYRKIAKEPGWTNVFDYVKGILGNIFSESSYHDFENSQMLSSCFYGKVRTMLDAFMMNNIYDFKGGTPIYNLVREAIESGMFDNQDTVTPQMAHFCDTLQMYPTSITVDTRSETNGRVSALIGKFRSGYPMMRILLDINGMPPTGAKPWQEIFDYIKMVDNAN